MTDYVTIPGVELATVGMKWQTAGGEVAFTFEHLADAMTAANKDPHVQAPRIGLGHDDPRFEDDEVQAHRHDPFYDAEPAFGQVANLRLENDGAVLVGDLVNVPAWLAEVMASAYPSRSVEGAFVDGAWDVETPGGKRYSFVVTRVSLLGIYLPAVEDLADLKGLLTAGEGVTVKGGAPAASIGDVPAPAARASVDKVVRLFMNEVATEDSGRYWWWARDVYTDPNQIVADDDEGGLWLVDFTSDDKQDVTFADPVKVLETFTPAPKEAAAAAAAGVRAGEPARHFADRVAAGARERPVAGGADRPGKTEGMDPAAEIRRLLGLEADATDDEVQAALDARDENEPTTEPDPEPADETTEPPAEDSPATEPDEAPAEQPQADAEPVAASGTVEVDRGTWDETRRQAREGAAARAEQITEGRERLLEDAVQAGKFPPARKDHYRTLHQADATGTEELIDRLETGLIPVDERGSSKDDPQGEHVPAEVMASFGPQYDPRNRS